MCQGSIVNRIPIFSSLVSRTPLPRTLIKVVAVDGYFNPLLNPFMNSVVLTLDICLRKRYGPSLSQLKSEEVFSQTCSKQGVKQMDCKFLVDPFVWTRS